MSQELNRVNEMGVTPAEETLRLVARMPAPEGLEERVKARLKEEPRSGRVLVWPGTDRRWSQSALARSAAAAMIVCVVGGGAWSMYSHVQSRTNAARAMPAPIRQVAPGSFSNAGAMRSPQGAVVVHPVKPQSKKSSEAKPKDEKAPNDAAKAKAVTPKSGAKNIQAIGNRLEPMKSPAPR